MTVHETPYVVAGGGLAGLAAALHLARRPGTSVTLYERASELGGRAQTLSRNGFALNLGPHAVLPAALELLAELGVDPPGASPPAAGLAIRGERAYLLPAGVGSLLRTRLLGPGAKFELARVLGRFQKIDAASANRTSVDDWLRSNVRNARVREMVGAFLRIATYTNAPGQQSAGFAIGQVQAALGGVRYVDGGWQTIVNALRTKAESAGVRIVTGERVESVRIEGSSIAGVTTGSGLSEPCAGVVLTGSPGDVVGLLPSSASSAVESFARRAVPARVAALDVALSRLPNPGTLFATGMDVPTYLSVHSATAKLAPAGGATIHVAKYLPTGDSDPAADRALLESQLDMVQPGWRPLVVHERFLPHLVASNAIITADDGPAGRPGVDAAGIGGLAIAGDWVGSRGQLLEAVLASARDAATMLAAEPRPVGATA